MKRAGQRMGWRCHLSTHLARGRRGPGVMERGPRDRPRPRGPGRSARNHVWGQQQVFALLIPGEMSELSVRVRVGREEAPNGEIEI